MLHIARGFGAYSHFIHFVWRNKGPESGVADNSFIEIIHNLLAGRGIIVECWYGEYGLVDSMRIRIRGLFNEGPAFSRWPTLGLVSLANNQEQRHSHRRNSWTRISLRVMTVIFPIRPALVELPRCFLCYRGVLALISVPVRTSKWKNVSPMAQISKGYCTYFSRSVK